MRKVSELLKDLGFNEKASPGAQEAFVKNLVRAAYGVEVKTPTERKKSVADGKNSQLSFAHEDLVAIHQVPNHLKRRIGRK